MIKRGEAKKYQEKILNSGNLAFYSNFLVLRREEPHALLLLIRHGHIWHGCHLVTLPLRSYEKEYIVETPGFILLTDQRLSRK